MKSRSAMEMLSGITDQANRATAVDSGWEHLSPGQPRMVNAELFVLRRIASSCGRNVYFGVIKANSTFMLSA